MRPISKWQHAKSRTGSEDRKFSTTSWRPVLIGLILIPINSFGILLMRISPTFSVPFYNVILFLLILIIANGLWRKFRLKSVLSPSELCVIYVMLSCSTALTCNHLLTELIPIIGHAAWYATTENEWRSLFFRYLPNWLTINDIRILRGYYEGGSNFHVENHIRGWLFPIICWTTFLTALVWVMLCINVIIRIQWTHSERLAYPVIELPREMVVPNNPIFRNQLFWLGVLIATTITMINGLHEIFPAIPGIPTKRRNINYLLTTPPWDALKSYGYITVSFYPFMIGLGFLMPLDLSFSCWFFFVVSKITLIFTTMAGWQSRPRMPFYDEQAFGAFLSICVFVMWSSRQHLHQIVLKVFRQSRVDDSMEPMSYRTACWGAIGGLIFLIFFSVKAGMALWLVCLLFAIYFALSVSVTRLRAELGFPAHSLWHATPYFVLLPTIGSAKIDPRSSTIFAIYRWFNFDWASHPMPHQLEGFKFADHTNTKQTKLTLAIMIATVVGTLSFFWLWLYLIYKEGAQSFRFNQHTNFYGGVAFQQLQQRLYQRLPSDYLGLTFIGLGFCFATFLAFMRRRFIWWQFHPLGYAMISDWATLSIWTCLLISSVIKWFVLKWMGLSGYRRIIPFFLGIILGEMAVGGIWAITAVWSGESIYRFWP